MLHMKRTVHTDTDVQYKKLVKRTQEFFIEAKAILDQCFDSGTLSGEV